MSKTQKNFASAMLNIIAGGLLIIAAVYAGVTQSFSIVGAFMLCLIGIGFLFVAAFFLNLWIQAGGKQ